MKKLIRVMMPVKFFAAMIFTGFILLYLVMGTLCAFILKEPFDYSVPFLFVIQDIVLSLLFSVLWSVLLGENVIRNMRYCTRLTLFAVSIIVLLAASFSVFLAIPTAWAKLWLLVAACVAAGIVILSVIAELYYRATGKKYTKILLEYKSNIKLP